MNVPHTVLGASSSFYTVYGLSWYLREWDILFSNIYTSIYTYVPVHLRCTSVGPASYLPLGIVVFMSLILGFGFFRCVFSFSCFFSSLFLLACYQIFHCWFWWELILKNFRMLIADFGCWYVYKI